MLFAVLHLVLGHLSAYGFHVKLHRRRRYHHQPFTIYTGTQVQANRGQKHTLPGRTKLCEFWYLFRFWVKVFFATGNANNLLSLTSSAYNKRTNALVKNLRHVLIRCVRKRMRSFLPFTFGWPGLKFTETFTFCNALAFWIFKRN